MLGVRPSLTRIASRGCAEDPLLCTLRGTRERDLRGVDVALRHRRLGVTGPSLHVYGGIPRRSVVRERGVAQVMLRADRSLDPCRRDRLSHVAGHLGGVQGRAEQRVTEHERLG